MVLPRPARLSAQALTWLLQAERIGEPHLVVAPAAVWHPPTDQAELRVRARNEIAALGWYDGRNRLEIEVAAALAILCRAEVEFFGWITHGRSTIGALAAGIGRHGLLAVRDGDSIWLKHISHSTLAESLAAQTTDVAAGHGKPVTLSCSEAAGSIGGRRITGSAVRVGPAGVSVRRVQRLIALPAPSGGELYVAVRDGVGRYQVSEPVHFADTPEGRYLNLTTGRDQALVAPATRADLAARLKEVRRALVTTGGLAGI